jgi:hypothetical protein
MCTAGVGLKWVRMKNGSADLDPESFRVRICNADLDAGLLGVEI